jgi:hypothetical protein
MKCRTCGDELTRVEMRYAHKECANCRSKRDLAREFVKTCEWFKQITNYEGIIAQRKRRNHG